MGELLWALGILAIVFVIGMWCGHKLSEKFGL